MDEMYDRLDKAAKREKVVREVARELRFFGAISGDQETVEMHGDNFRSQINEWADRLEGR